MRCTPDLRFCQARGLRLEVPAASEGNEPQPVGVSTAARCALSESFPRTGIGRKGLTLSDWSPELKAFAGADGDRPCDVKIPQPTLLIKPDSRNNIYHGLCDHANLYLSMWIAGWAEVEDLEIVYWEPRVSGERVRSPWYELFDAFTDAPVVPLGHYAGSSMCFDQAMLAVNPRSLRTFYYNMYVPGRDLGCRSGAGGFLRSFGERTKARLLPAPPRQPAAEDPVRIKIMSRSKGTGRTSGTRQVTNETELAAAVRRRIPGTEVEIVNFDWNGRPSIEGQVALMTDTDVLVGMHGAGLVHTLWLPPWAVVLEIYNCGDVNTYRDLARMMGVGYLTGEAADVTRLVPQVPVREQSKPNPKFWNYQVDEDAYVARVAEAVRRVRAHPASPFRQPPAASQGEGYLLYCPCMGRLGNQVAQLVGTLEVARASGRTLVLPPFIDYRRSGTYFRPFGEIFDVETVRQLVPAVTMEEFLSDPDLETKWPAAERRLYCPRRDDSGKCKMPAGNPHKTFWDHFGIEFTGSLATASSSAKLVADLAAAEHPVIALGGPPGRFPVAPENRHLQRHLVWNDEIRQRGEDFIAEHLPRPFLAVHLRNGDDWKSACRVGEGGPEQPQYMSSPQCGLVRPQAGASAANVPERVCYPDPAEAVRAIQAAQKRFGPFRAVFIGTDRHDYREQIEAAVGPDVKVVRGDTPTLDLTVFGQADLLIANCVSSFSALAVRERQVHGRPSVFFGFDEWTEDSYKGQAP